MRWCCRPPTPLSRSAVPPYPNSPALHSLHSTSQFIAGELQVSFEGHTADVLSLAVSADSAVCVSASADTTIRAWNLQKRVQSPSPAQPSTNPLPLPLIKVFGIWTALLNNINNAIFG